MWLRERLRNALELKLWEVIPQFRHRRQDCWRAGIGRSRRFCLRDRMMPPPPPVRRPRPGWAAAPATYLLVGINCAVFLAMVAQGREHR